MPRPFNQRAIAATLSKQFAGLFSVGHNYWTYKTFKVRYSPGWYASKTPKQDEQRKQALAGMKTLLESKGFIIEETGGEKHPALNVLGRDDMPLPSLVEAYMRSSEEFSEKHGFFFYAPSTDAVSLCFYLYQSPKIDLSALANEIMEYLKSKRFIVSRIDGDPDDLYDKHPPRIVVTGREEPPK